LRITTRLWLVFGALIAALTSVILVAAHRLDQIGNPNAIVVGAVVAAVAVTLALVAVLRRRFTVPLRALVDGVNKFGAGATHHRIEVGSQDELGELAIAFNRMASQRHTAEREVERLRHQGDLILKAAAEGICGLDRDGVLTFVNPAATQMLGYRPEEVLGKSEHALLHHSGPEGTLHSEERCPIRRTLVEGNAVSIRDEVFWRKDGSSLPVEYTCTPIEESGVIVGAVVTFRDITEQRALERIKDEFLSVVSHELRTPLTSIRGALGLIASGMLGEVPEKGRRMLDIAVTNSERLVRLINDILDIERMESGKVIPQFQTCNAADLMTQAGETMRAMAQENGIVLTVTPVWAQLNVDPDRILQMLTNLLSNAIKFSDRGSRVWLTADRRGSELVIQVGDQGRGIPADRLETIFERFQQVDASDSREKGGTGLGLAICKMIVEQHEGRVWVRSTLGKGSVFHCALPVKGGATTHVGPSGARPGEESIPASTLERKALVISGGEDGNHPIFDALRRLEVTVIHAHSFRDVIRFATNTGPSLVVIDAGSDDPDPVRVLEWMKRQDASQAVPSVVFGGSGNLEDLTRLRTAGADHVVSDGDSADVVGSSILGLLASGAEAP
jgi:PAS domain S-box-containing protein